MSFDLFSQSRCQSRVRLRRQLSHRLLLGVRQALKPINELQILRFADLGLASREIFQLFIGVGNVKLSHHGLDRLSEKLVVLVQLTVEFFGVDGDATETFLERGDGLQVVAESDA